MNAKEKAKSLVDMMERSKDMPYQYAKQCAIIAVDEILNAVKGMVDEENGYSSDEYYLDVKQEIEKL